MKVPPVLSVSMRVIRGGKRAIIVSRALTVNVTPRPQLLRFIVYHHEICGDNSGGVVYIASVRAAISAG